LKKMSLKKEPGQNVINFSKGVIELARKIEGSILDVPNLNSLVLAPFLHCDVEAFRLFVTEKHMRADRVTGNTTISILATAGVQAQNATPQWMIDINDLKTRFRELKGQNLWTPLNSGKPRDDEFKSLKAELHKLQQSVSRQGKPPRDKSSVTCFNCGKQGHYSRDCKSPRQGQGAGGGGGPPPDRRPGAPPQGGQDSWKSVPPKAGESEVKTVDGVVWKFCTKCFFKKWRAGPKCHTTPEHKSKTDGAPPGGARKLNVGQQLTMQSSLFSCIEIEDTSKLESLSMDHEADVGATIDVEPPSVEHKDEEESRLKQEAIDEIHALHAASLERMKHCDKVPDDDTDYSHLNC